ncbi:unnamed protein product [Darwinula stevensoni]|uniref:Uncharacterized protein n=1 Tax=Darwinula stevensoni TaxID=69355 RepID=A0A7R9ADZ9_9CRUS|nr:unnamed protein product [Darwinula stevensoni]CAG0901512.1 unnamed protein product [Darwinula stevensoni]
MMNEFVGSNQTYYFGSGRCVLLTSSKCLYFPSGRYESEFIEHRRSMLESWVQRVSRHPVLARSEVWRHFVSCTDDKAWKVGKRKAERDELVGAKLFLAIDAPESPLAPDTVELQVEGFGKFVHLLEKSVANLQVTALDQIKKMIRHYRREHLTVGNAFRQLGTALDNDTAHCMLLYLLLAFPLILTNLSILHGCDFLDPEKVKNALKYTGQAYEDIAKLCEDQPKTDWEPLSDKLHEYRGMLSAFPEILHLHKGALQKRREYQRLGAEGKLDKQQVDGVVRRTDIVSYAVLAEMSHFREELARDANDMMKAYLKEQIAFYRRVTEKLEDSLKQYS